MTAATSIVSMILDDAEVQVGLAGVPHYFYGMIAFACVFLAKAARRHSAQLFIDREEVRVLIERLSDQMSATEVGRGHVIHRMAGGLRKMAESLRTKGSHQRTSITESKLSVKTQNINHVASRNALPPSVDSTSFDQFSALDSFDVGFGDAAFGFGMPFFDFEGANLDMSSPAFPFPT